jgi:hypothetical protein
VSERTAFAFARTLGSIWSLELLIILSSNPRRCWLADELELEVRGSARVVGEALSVLARLGLTAQDAFQHWGYTPNSPDLERLTSELVRLYATKRLSVINAIHASPIDRMLAFASAFKIRD